MEKKEKRQPGGLYEGLGATSTFRSRKTNLSILVPSDMVGVIIGRGGSRINEIKKQTLASINVTNDIVEYSEKVITINGIPEMCTNACQKILEVMQKKVPNINKSDVLLKILIHDNLMGLIIGENGNTIKNIMSETETKINVSSITKITIDNINFKSLCTVEGSIENISKAESLVSAKLRQSFEKYLPPITINVEPVMDVRHYSKIRLPHFSYVCPGATPTRSRQTESLLCILVHSSIVHAIIGNRGSNIKEITQQTRAWVHVDLKVNFDSMEKAIIIKGSPENCTHACLKILEVLQQKATNTCRSDMILKILIPDNPIGIIIKEKGNTIMKIMSETETNINVSSITDVKIDSFNYKSICTVGGSIENISKAESLISEKLRQSIENYLPYENIKVKPFMEMKQLIVTGFAHVLHEDPKTIPAIENRIDFTLRILVQSDMIPVIIGKRGSTVKEITQQTSARVHVDHKNSVGITEKAITIKGIPENCTNACRKILYIMQLKATNTCRSDVMLKILIHNDLIGVIIGEEGNTIRKIMLETNTYITAPSITDVTIDSFNYERIFTVKGSVENMSKAEAQISAKLRQHFENISLYKLIRLVKPEAINKKYKLIIVGHSNVGKSSIIKRYCKDIYQFSKPTIGTRMDIQQIFIKFKNETIHLEIRDIAGTEKYCSLANLYKGVHGVYIVYDITDFNSSHNLDGWIKNIETFSDPNAVKILIGSKCDNTSNRKISVEEGQRISEVYRIPFFEVSSKTNVNIDKLFYTMISRIHEVHEYQSTNIKKEEQAACPPGSDKDSNNINVINKPILNSDVKPSTIPMQCPKMEKDLLDVPNIQSEYDDRELYKLVKIKPETTNEKYKLIIVGQSNVGKSTIISRLCNGVYQDTVPTIGIEFHEIFVRLKNEIICLNIWDTAGTEKYRSIAQQYYRGAHGVFIVYDITDLNSFLKLDCWIEDVKNFSDKNAVKILIGNKRDNKSNRKISIKEGQLKANIHGISFFEVSSKSNENIDKLFHTMVSTLHDLQKQPTDIQKELEHKNVINKPILNSDVKPSTIQMQCPKMEKDLLDVPNIQSEYDDRELYKLVKIKPGKTNEKYKLIIVGQSNVGKSTIINRLCNSVYQDTKATIGMDFHEIFVTHNNKNICLNIWDTAGTEKYRSLAQQYYRGAHGVFIVYDITDLNSFLKLRDWINDIENFSDKNAVKILIGSKCDNKSNRKISIKEGQLIAENLQIPWFEVSSKTNENLDKLFYTMISKIRKLHAQPIAVQNNDSIRLEVYEEISTTKTSSGGCWC